MTSTTAQQQFTAPVRARQATSGFGNVYRFTARRFDDATGLYYYRNRYYDSRSGRFISRDPEGYIEEMNLYAYARNNPATRSDPMGLDSWGDVWEWWKARRRGKELDKKIEERRRKKRKKNKNKSTTATVKDLAKAINKARKSAKKGLRGRAGCRGLDSVTVSLCNCLMNNTGRKLLDCLCKITSWTNGECKKRFGPLVRGWSLVQKCKTPSSKTKKKLAASLEVT